MKPTLILFFLLPLLASLPTILDAQSPWPRSKAGFYAQAAWQFIPAYQSIYSNTDIAQPLDRELSENAFQLYGEYGISKKTTLTASLPIRFLKAGEFLNNFAVPETEAGTLSGLGNVSLGVRQAICEGKVRLTGSLRLDFPVDNYDDATGLSAGYNAWTFLPMLSAGQGLGKGYWFAYAGYGLRTNEFSQFLNVGAEGGYRLKRVWLIGFADWMLPMENGDVELPFHNRLTGLYVNDQGWLALGLKSIVEFDRFWGAVLTATGAADGQWVPQRPAFSFGAYFKWD